MKKCITLLFFLMVQAGFSQWEPCGNDLYGGMASWFAFKGDSVFAYSGKGLYLSTNKGEVWTNVPDWQFPDSSGKAKCYCVANSGNRMIAGTSRGVFVSDDGAKTWTKTGDSAVSQIVVCGDDVWTLGTNYQIALSTDKGASWTQKGKANYSDNDQFYASEKGLYRSYYSSSCLGSDCHLFLYPRADKEMEEIPVDKEIPGINGLIVEKDSIFIGDWTGILYLSTDSGKVWTKTSNPGIPAGLKYLFKIGSTIYAVGNYGSIFSTADYGDTWASKAIDCPENSYYSLFANNGSDVWLSTFSKIFLADLKKHTWKQKNKGMSCITVNNLVCSGNILWMSIDNQVYLSKDLGLSWQLNRTFNHDISTISAYRNGIIVGLCGGGPGKNDWVIYTLDDLNGSWKRLYQSYQGIFQIITRQETDIWASVNCTGISSGDGHVIHSTDNGATWQKSNSGYGTLILAAVGNDIWVLSDKINITSDNGATWQSKKFEVADRYLRKIVNIGPNLYAYAHHMSNLPVDEVYKSTDNGKSWKLAINKFDSDERNYCSSIENNIIASSNGSKVYYLPDEADEWCEIKNETGYGIIPLAKSKGCIFGAAYGAGVWRTKADYLGIPISVEERQAEAGCLGLFPNPAGDCITITTDGSMPRVVEIINMLGIKVAEYVVENSRASLNIKSLPEGVYLLKAGNRSNVFVKR